MGSLAILCVMVTACYFLSIEMLTMRVEATTIRMHNQCGSTVCFKRFGPNNGVGGACSEQPPGGTWSQGASPSWSSVTMWAITNTGCGGQACNTGPPGGVTQFEITVDGFAGSDYYDVSKIAGFNGNMRGVPTNGNCGQPECTSADSGNCYYNGGPEATNNCPTGTDYDVYMCPP